MRTEFAKAVKAAAAIRAKGKCESCTRKLLTGDYHYDHIIADALGGAATLKNCAVVCRSCHSTKTAKADVPAIAKAKRREKGRFGIKKPRTITRWRKMNGQPVFASRER